MVMILGKTWTLKIMRLSNGLAFHYTIGDVKPKEEYTNMFMLI